MARVAPIWVIICTSFFISSMVISEKVEVKQALVEFMEKLSPENVPRDANWGWNLTSDPCTHMWKGIACDRTSKSVRKIVLEQLNLTGVLDLNSLCVAQPLIVLSLQYNNAVGNISDHISNCRDLTHLYLSGNRLSGKLPSSLSKLNKLKRIDLSNNDFSGELPDMSRISGLLSFLVQNNELSGPIPSFNFSNLEEFNVSNNNFSGPVPHDKGDFESSSFSGNLELCGEPMSNVCPTAKKKGKTSSAPYFIYSGYAILGLIVVLVSAFILIKTNRRHKDKNNKDVKKGVQVDNKDNTTSASSSSSGEFKATGNRAENSMTSDESGVVSQSLVILSSPVVKGLRLEDLLQSPAELVERGKQGSLYKVILDGGMTLAVKRIEDWRISKDDFKKTMQRIDQVQHPKVLPIFAYYCTKQEKLLVYEFQQNGSLSRLLQGSTNGQVFYWLNRLNVAASIAKALAFMHEELRDDGIAHGNLKSTNILLNNDLEPCISEYGLKVIESQDQSFFAQSNSYKNNDQTGGRAYSTFKVDIYAFGVILLELLTGKLVQDSGSDLARWVNSIVREEWTAEVFDRSLISEGACDKKMMNLLQVALKCVNPSPEARPTISQVAAIINSIKEDEGIVKL